MSKHFLTLLVSLLFGTLGAWADGKPQASTEGNEQWYLIQFMNGGNAITADTQGAEITTSAAVGNAAQLWKFTGDDTNGYTITNKKGLTLYTPSGQKNNKVSASASPSGVTRYKIVPTTNGSYSGGYEIQPYNSSSVSMNLWGGPSENRGVGLWDKGDQNNAVSFTTEKAFNGTADLSIVPYPQNLEVTKEGALNFATITTLAYPDVDCLPHAEEFAAQWKAASGAELDLTEGRGSGNPQAVC